MVYKYFRIKLSQIYTFRKLNYSPILLSLAIRIVEYFLFEFSKKALYLSKIIHYERNKNKAHPRDAEQNAGRDCAKAEPHSAGLQ